MGGDGIVIPPPPPWARGPIGISREPTRHSLSPQQMGKVGGSRVLIQTLGWGGGRTRSGEPTSSLAFLPAAELVAPTKEQLARPLTAASV